MAVVLKDVVLICPRMDYLGYVEGLDHVLGDLVVASNDYIIYILTSEDH